MIKKDATGSIPMELFQEQFPGATIDFKYFTIEPKSRVPLEGTGSHVEHEFSYIIEGELVGESGGEEFHIQAGEASYIPAGEEHWSYNPTNEQVKLIAVMLKA